MALPKIVRIQYNSDFTLNCKLPNGYSGEDFIIRLYTTDKDNYFEASYLNGEYSNCLTDSENKNVTIYVNNCSYSYSYVNNYGLQPGCLHIGMKIDYDNTHFQDNIENIITAEETNVYLVKQNANATSAMYVGSALPDLTGSSDFITESDLEFELLNYYTKEEIDNAGYISSADLNDFVTEEELNDMGFLSAAQLDAMGYTTKDYVDTKTSQKQDRLISAVNIKTVNGYSLLGNGNINISGVSQDDLNNAIAPLVSQEALTETLSYYATESFVYDSIADAMIDINVPTYTSDLTNDSGFITESDVNNLLSTASYLNQSDLESQLEQAGYVTSSELSNAGYITNQDLEQTLSNATYVTSSELSNAGYATETYVSDYVAQHAPTPDLSAYVTYDWLEAQSYLTQSDLAQAGYITQSDLSNASYVTESEISSMGYITSSALNGLATETYVTNAISGINIPTYTSDLTNDSGFITSIPAEYITQSELSSMSYVTQSALNSASYATTSQLANKQDTLVSGTNIKTVNNNSLLGSGNITISSSGNLIAEVTTAEYEAMQQAGTLDPNTIYVITDAPATDLSYYAELSYVDTYYVSKEQLDNAGYLSSIPNTYATYAAISNMGYVTQTQLNNAGYLTSIPNTYATYAAISNMGYLTSAIFQYDSSTYTLTINI